MPTFDLSDTPPTDTHADTYTDPVATVDTLTDTHTTASLDPGSLDPSSPDTWDDLPTQEIPAETMRELVFGLGSHPDLHTRIDQQALDTLAATTLTQEGTGVGHQAIGPDRATRDMRPLSRRPTEAMVPLESATGPTRLNTKELDSVSDSSRPGDTAYIRDRGRSDKITLPYVFVVPDTFEVTDVLVGEDGFVSTELSDGIPQVEGDEATQPSIYTTVISRVA